MAEGIPVGGKAPAFTLVNQDGRKVALKDFLGSWLVLYFYPKDDTPGCTTEACEFTAGIKEFDGLQARVVGVSPDEPASHRKFIDKYQISFDLLSDPDHAVLEQYGAWGEKKNYGKTYQGVIRSTLIIDPKGKIAHHWPNVKAAGHAGQVAARLAELQKV